METYVSHNHDFWKNVQKIARSGYLAFFRDLFPLALDLLIISDCTNRFVLICTPQQKDNLVNRKMIAAYFGTDFTSLYNGFKSNGNPPIIDVKKT